MKGQAVVNIARPRAGFEGQANRVSFGYYSMAGKLASGFGYGRVPKRPSGLVSNSKERGDAT